MKSYQKPIITLILCLIFALLPLSKDYSNVNGGLNFFPTPAEIAIGTFLNAQIQMKFPIVEDEEINSYINSLGEKLVEHSKRRDIDYHFYVVNTSDVNAFALPGGFIYVYRGLIEMCDNEGELAGVLGHEIGHVVAKHSVKLLSKDLLMKGILKSTDYGISQKSKKWAKVISSIGGAGAYLAELKFSRDDERQADYLAIKEMMDAGYDPNCFVSFFKKLKRLSEESGAELIPTFLRTHPLTQERIENAIEEIENSNYTGGGIKDSEEFRNFKDRVRSLPQPVQNVLERLLGGNFINSGSGGKVVKLEKTIEVPGDTAFLNTDIFVNVGDIVEIKADGEISLGGISNTSCGPDGTVSMGGFVKKPLDYEPTGCLIGKIGSGSYFKIGNYKKFVSEDVGILLLGINDGNPFDNGGKFKVKIRILGK